MREYIETQLHDGRTLVNIVNGLTLDAATVADAMLLAHAFTDHGQSLMDALRHRIQGATLVAGLKALGNGRPIVFEIYGCVVAGAKLCHTAIVASCGDAAVVYEMNGDGDVLIHSAGSHGPWPGYHAEGMTHSRLFASLGVSDGDVLIKLDMAARTFQDIRRDGHLTYDQWGPNEYRLHTGPGISPYMDVTMNCNNFTRDIWSWAVGSACAASNIDHFAARAWARYRQSYPGLDRPLVAAQ